MTNHLDITCLYLCMVVWIVTGGRDCSSNIKPTKISPCPEGMRDDGVNCLKDSYSRGVGRVPDKSPCERGEQDDGSSCWIDSYSRGTGRSAHKGPCPSGLRDDGTNCLSDAHTSRKGCCCSMWGCCNNCPNGYTDDGCTCNKTNVGIQIDLFQRLTCKEVEDKYDSRCYPKCKAGFTPIGCCNCEPNNGRRIVRNLKSRQICRENEVMYRRLCYPKCKDGYSPIGFNICEPVGGPGIKITEPERRFCEENDLKFNDVYINTKGCSSEELVAEMQKRTTLSPPMVNHLKEKIASNEN